MQQHNDITCLKLAEQRHQIGQRASEAIDAPGSDDVELTPGHALHQRVETGTTIAAVGAADALVVEDRDDGPAEALGDLVQVAKLVLGGLAVRGRDPDVERGPSSRR